MSKKALLLLLAAWVLFLSFMNDQYLRGVDACRRRVSFSCRWGGGILTLFQKVRS